MKVIIDRIEDGVASVELESGEIISVSSKLFEGCKEGDIVYINVDKEETERERERLQKELDELLNQ